MYWTQNPISELTRSQYRDRVTELRVDLLRLQYELHKSRGSMIVVIAGNDLIGCSDILNLFHGWMDPRYLEANAFIAPTEDEKEYPLFWRYWNTLVPKGRIGIFVRGWASQGIAQRMQNRIDDNELKRRIRHMRRFEKILVDDGVLLVKFWLHLPKAALAKRLKAASKNPEKSWKVHPEDRRIYEHYDRSRKIAKLVLRETSTEDAPWQIVESTDSRFRDLAVGESLRNALLKFPETTSAKPENRNLSTADTNHGTTESYLQKTDLTRSLKKGDYDKKLNYWQGKLNRVTHDAFDRKISSILVFEGWDAAGKGGIIRRFTAAVDATIFRVIPIAAPTDEELAHHYLWRFWRQLPRKGRIAIFDRSWYGRVLVERVEGFASEAEWQRAYSEINDFEEQLFEHGIVVVKFWIQIDADIQIQRFRDREKTPFKQHKITVEDYRNRDRWKDYELAANDMIHRTTTEYAKWHVIPGNDKRWARINVLKAIHKNLKRAL